MPFSDLFPKVSQAPSKCFFKWINWINWIKSRIPRQTWKIIFVLSSYELLAILEGKIGKGPFFRVQSDELIVCLEFANVYIYCKVRLYSIHICKFQDIIHFYSWHVARTRELLNYFGPSYLLTCYYFYEWNSWTKI